MSETVVITGGTAGVGRAFARRFARGGAKVAVLGRGLDDLRQTAIDLVTQGASAALMIPCDVTNVEQVARATARIEEELGPIDVWIDADDPDDEPSARERALRIGAAVGLAAIAAIGIILIAPRIKSAIKSAL
ncbi:MAG TPA: SDR family NAD(P)-dependent oxidoreductase [Kofleriaceae bacterium]|nr:SDR family NAD(P)-dependent oxidoreductase [Kofleriaceae bacterium]